MQENPRGAGCGELGIPLLTPGWLQKLRPSSPEPQGWGLGSALSPGLAPSPCRGVTSYFRPLFSLYLCIVSPVKGCHSPFPRGRRLQAVGERGTRRSWRSLAELPCRPGPSPRRLVRGSAGCSSSFPFHLPSHREGRGLGLDGTADLRAGHSLCKARGFLLRSRGGEGGRGHTNP